MLSNILNLLSAKIEIEVSPDRFVFKRDDVIKSISTKVYLSNNSTKAIIIGIGDEFIATQPNICVELFQEIQEGELPNLVKSKCLDAFFMHAFRLITRRTAMIRPRVVFKNSQSLHALLCGYQDIILRTAATNAGARECLFEN
jgi:hypothetical protein